MPRARFIHILRDGRDVVASLYRATQSNPRLWGGRLSARACVDRWNADIQHSMRYRNRPEHLLLRYSDLVSAPERQSRVICAFLEIGYEPMMVAPERAFTEIVRPEERWKSNNATPIQPKESAFDSLFDADEREWILKHLIRFSASDGLGRTAI